MLPFARIDIRWMADARKTWGQETKSVRVIQRRDKKVMNANMRSFAVYKEEVGKQSIHGVNNSVILQTVSTAGDRSKLSRFFFGDDAYKIHG